MFYRISELARKASISTRTLRHYDRVGLLSPSARSDGGYRLYTEADLHRLQYMLTLKFLGFSLEEIKACVAAGPQRLPDMLAQQTAMLVEKRQHLDRMLAALERAQAGLAAGGSESDLLEQLTGVMQMDQKPEWIAKYLTREQRRQMRDLAAASYTPEALSKMGAGGWTDADLREHMDRYAAFRDGLRKLMAEGADPTGAAAQAVAGQLQALIDSRAQGDPTILAGMREAWQNYMALPAEQRPPHYELTEAEQAFLRQAMVARHRRQAPQA